MSVIDSVTAPLKKINVYDFTIYSLIIIAFIGLFVNSFLGLLQAVIVPIIAVILDFLLNKFLKGRDFFPKSGLITGLLVSIIIPSDSLIVAISAIVVAILVKHVLFQFKVTNFNPAAIGALFSLLLFNASSGWWAATLSPSQPLTFAVVLLALIASWKLNKLPLTLSFMAADLIFSVYFRVGLSSFMAIAGFALLSFFSGSFFAGFMLTEPKSSTRVFNAMVLEGFLLFAVSWLIPFIVPEFLLNLDPLLASLLFFNALTPFLNNLFNKQPAIPSASI